MYLQDGVTSAMLQKSSPTPRIVRLKKDLVESFIILAVISHDPLSQLVQDPRGISLII